jgi:tetratricopeptide (TPR) repeat protein
MQALRLLALVILPFFSSCSHHSLFMKKPVMDRQTEKQSLQTPEQLDSLVSEALRDPKLKDYFATDLFLKANMALLDGDFETAVFLFKYVTTLAPEDEFVLKKYAISLIRLGQLEEAKLVLEKIFAKSSQTRVGMILAGLYTGLDQQDKAEKIYVGLLKKDPSNEDACIFLANAYVLRKSYNRAERQLVSCANRDKNNGIYEFYLGKLFHDQQKISQAISYFKKAYFKGPQLSQVVNALGGIYEDQGQHELALDLYQLHLKKFPKDEVVLKRIVQLLFEKEMYTEVISYAEQLSDLGPDDTSLKVKLGVLYTDAKQYQNAISVFKELLALAPSSDKLLYYLGAIYQELKDYPEAIDYFNQIPVTSGLYADSSIQMANMLSTLAQEEFYKDKGKKWEKLFITRVDQMFSQIKELKVEFAVIKAGFYEATGQFPLAADSLVAVRGEESFKLQHKYYLANLYERSKRFNESTNIILEIISLEPKNAHAWNFLGYAMLERGEELEKAYEYIQKALSLNPDDGYIRDSLGWYYFKKGEIHKAQSELQFALQKVPDDIEILKHLAIVYTKLKKNNQARDLLETALKYARYPNDRHSIMSSIQDLEAGRLPASGAKD